MFSHNYQLLLLNIAMLYLDSPHSVGFFQWIQGEMPYRPKMN